MPVFECVRCCATNAFTQLIRINGAFNKRIITYRKASRYGKLFCCFAFCCFCCFAVCLFCFLVQIKLHNSFHNAKEVVTAVSFVNTARSSSLIK